jgi:hypothetical protein
VSQLSPRLIVLLLFAAAVAGIGLISKSTLGGKDGPGDSAAAQVIDRALNNSNFRSGRFRASFKTELQGENVPPQLANALSANVSGAFNDRGAGKPPELDMTMRMSLGRTIEMRVVSTGKEGFVSFGGRNYHATAADFQRTYGQLGRPQEELGLAALGIQPRDWIKNAKHQGTASIDGVATDHVSAELNVERMLDDIATVSSKYPQAGASQISSKEIEEAKDAIKGGTLEIYASKRDGIIRKAALQVEVEAEDGRGTFDFTIDFAEVNKRQRIVPPAGGVPINRLESDISSGALNPLAAAATGSAEAAPTPSGGAQTTAVPPETQGYLGCVQSATTEPELARCSSLLP